MMVCISTLLLVSFSLPVIAKKTGKFSLSITKDKEILPRIIPPQFNQDGSTQKLLHTFKEDSRSRGYPIEPLSFPYCTYTTNISIGTPPQSFRTVIDLGWSDLFLPSSTCGSPSPRLCTPSNASYNASASSTYHDNGTNTYFGYRDLYGRARLSEDILSFADGLQVHGQVFHEIKYYDRYDDSFDLQFPDGVLGLVAERQYWLPHLGTKNILPSPFKNMVDQNVLDVNMFSTIWPTAGRAQGSLIFGGYDDDLLDGELISHPLFPKNTTEWQIQIESVSMVSSPKGSPKKVLVHQPIPDGAAYFMSTAPVIAFESNLASEMLEYLKPWTDYSCIRQRAVRCNDRSSLPHIIIGFNGQNITLTGEDYATKLDVPKLGRCSDFDARNMCFVMIDFMGSTDDLVILGTPFLEKVMGVWNWDAKTISFGNLKEQ